VTPFASVRSLTVRHIGRKRPALRDLDLDWREGERLLLLGPSGSGKSTLALCLDGVIPHGIDAHWESGGVSVDGRDTRAASLAELAATVGVLFQDPETQLVMLETDDEIAFGLENLGLSREEMRTRIAEARAATGLGPSTPRRLDQLSGGTKQRVSLAALLAMRPRALVLDEPTANLDPVGAREILAAYAALCADRARSQTLKPSYQSLEGRRLSIAPDTQSHAHEADCLRQGSSLAQLRSTVRCCDSAVTSESSRFDSYQ